MSKKPNHYKFAKLAQQTLDDVELYNPQIHCQHIPRQVLMNTAENHPSKYMQTAFRIYKLSQTENKKIWSTILGRAEEDLTRLVYITWCCARKLSCDNLGSCIDLKRLLKSLGIYNFHCLHHAWKAKSKYKYSRENEFVMLTQYVPKILRAIKYEYPDLCDAFPAITTNVTASAKCYRDYKETLDRSVSGIFLLSLSVLRSVYIKYGQYVTLKHFVLFKHRYPDLNYLEKSIRYAYDFFDERDGAEVAESVISSIHNTLNTDIVRNINKNASIKPTNFFN